MSGDIDTANSTGGSSSTTLLFVLISVVLAVLFYILIRYGCSAIRVWRAQLISDATDQAPELGLSLSDIETFPTFIYRGATQNVTGSTNINSSEISKISKHGMANSTRHGNSVDCSICLCDLDADDVVRMLPGCRHFFHIKCIDVWLYSHPSCPICRAKLPNKTKSVQLAECSMSPPTPQFRQCCTLRGIGSKITNIPTTTQAAEPVPYVEEINEIVVEQESKMATSTHNSESSDQVKIHVKDDVGTEICTGEYSILPRETLLVTQNISMGASMPESDIESHLRCISKVASGDVQMH